MGNRGWTPHFLPETEKNSAWEGERNVEIYHWVSDLDRIWASIFIYMKKKKKKKMMITIIIICNIASSVLGILNAYR